MSLIMVMAMITTIVMIMVMITTMVMATIMTIDNDDVRWFGTLLMC